MLFYLNVLLLQLTSLNVRLVTIYEISTFDRVCLKREKRQWRRLVEIYSTIKKEAKVEELNMKWVEGKHFSTIKRSNTHFRYGVKKNSLQGGIFILDMQDQFQMLINLNPVLFWQYLSQFHKHQRNLWGRILTWERVP